MKPRASRSRWRAIGFRLAALGVGLLPLLLCELTLLAFDVGRSIPPEDPFVGFSATYPLFELDPTRTRYQTAANRLVYFQRDSFAAHKSPREYRIFVLGGSTVQGRPFAIETAFSTWLELSLQAADPSRVWQVVNCGGVSYASYRLAPIVDEILHYKPDLVILCTGHNEYLEDRSYDTLKSVPGVVRWPVELLSNTRTARLLEGIVRSASEPEEETKRPLLTAEVDAMLDYRGGLARYHRDDAWHSGVEAHFAYNVERMIRACQNAGVPVLHVLPVYNLDCPPFKSEHRKGLSLADQTRFRALWDEARDLYGRSMPLAIERLKAAAEIDPEHAGLQYSLGKCLQQVGRLDEAREALLRAKDEDICPLRMTEGLRRHSIDVAERARVPMIDLVPIFTGRSKGGILGPDWLVDHVHPSIAGHQLIADVLLDRMVKMGVVTRSQGWKSRRDSRYEEQLAGLSDMYYLKGQDRLERLQLWAAGRARRLRRTSRTPAITAPAPSESAPKREPET